MSAPVDIAGHRLSAQQLRALGGHVPPPPPVLFEITGRLVLHADTTPAGDADSYGGDADVIVHRDPLTGLPQLRATTQAGVLRHHLRSLELPVPGPTMPDPAAVTALFGDTTRPSRIGISTGTPVGTPKVELRPGNQGDPAHGRVAPGGLWLAEVLPAGTVFTLPWTLRLPRHPDAPAVATAGPPPVADDAIGLVASLLRAAAGFDDGSIRIGMRSGRGRGQVATTGWTVTAHDLATPAGFAAWYGRPWPQRHPVAAEGAPTLAQALRQTLGEDLLAQITAELGAAVDHREQLRLRLRLSNAEPQPFAAPPAARRDTTMLQVGEISAVKQDDAVTQDGADTEPAAEVGSDAEQPSPRRRTVNVRRPLSRPYGAAGGKPVPIDSGNALFRALKQHARRILSAIAEATEDSGGGAAVDSAVDSATDAAAPALAAVPERRGRAERVRRDLFGGEPRDCTPRPARLRVSEAPFRGDLAETSTTRIRQNPLTLGAVDHHLVEERPLHGGHVEVTLTVRRATRADLGLLALLVRDLRDGLGEPGGSGVNHGHGRRLLTALSGTLTAHWPGQPEETPETGQSAPPRWVWTGVADFLADPVVSDAVIDLGDTIRRAPQLATQPGPTIIPAHRRHVPDSPAPDGCLGRVGEQEAQQ